MIRITGYVLGFLILIITALAIIYIPYILPTQEFVKEKAINFVRDCESKNYTTCEYYYNGGVSRSEFINEVEKQGWKLETVAGRYADYLYFRKEKT